MESIDRLRQAADELAQRAMPCSNAPDYADVRWKVHQLADAIEREVDDMWHALTIDAKPMTDENMAESGWIRLPLDAEGVPIHIGDVMEWDNGTFAVHELKVTEDGWTTWDEQHGYTVHVDVCHRRAPTVEDVLREFAAKVEPSWRVTELPNATLAEFAAKLRLAGDE